MSDLAETRRLLKVDVKDMSEPMLETCRWSFCEQILHAAVAAVNVTFVGPKGCQTRLERSAMSLFKEEGDLALRPHVLVNSLLFRERRDGEAIMFKGKPLSESYAAVQAMMTEFDARSRQRAQGPQHGDRAVHRSLGHCQRACRRPVGGTLGARGRCGGGGVPRGRAGSAHDARRRAPSARAAAGGGARGAVGNVPVRATGGDVVRRCGRRHAGVGPPDGRGQRTCVCRGWRV